MFIYCPSCWCSKDFARELVENLWLGNLCKKSEANSNILHSHMPPACIMYENSHTLHTLACFTKVKSLWSQYHMRNSGLCEQWHPLSTGRFHNLIWIKYCFDWKCWYILIKEHNSIDCSPAPLFFFLLVWCCWDSLSPCFNTCPIFIHSVNLVSQAGSAKGNPYLFFSLPWVSAFAYILKS